MKMPSKKVIIPVSILLVIIICLIIFYMSIVSSKTISARLMVESEEVFVNGKAVSGDYILDEKDTVSTSETGKASIILYESVVVVLEPDTVIVVEELAKENPKLYQEKGETWNQFTKLLGIENYEIRTSTSVASVRGTGFSLADSLILVENGTVNYEVFNKSYTVRGGRAVEKFGEGVRERDLTPEEKLKLKEKKLKAIKSLKKLRQLEIDKHPKLMKITKNKYGFTEEEINSFLEDADSGLIDLNDFKDKVPFKVDSIEKVIKITEKIKEIKSSL